MLIDLTNKKIRNDNIVIDMMINIFNFSTFGLVYELIIFWIVFGMILIMMFLKKYAGAGDIKLILSSGLSFSLFDWSNFMIICACLLFITHVFYIFIKIPKLKNANIVFSPIPAAPAIIISRLFAKNGLLY